MESPFAVVAAVLVWILFVGLGAYISTQKNRQAIEGVLLALLFGPLGLIIAALLPTKPMVPPPPQAPMQQRSIRHQPAETSIPEEPIRQIPGDWGSKMDDDEAMKYLDG